GGYTGARTLAEDVMESLKKRVDPDGVRNLIWRPQGNTRLEIQMPLSSVSAEAKARRDAFASSQKELEATNVRYADVTAAVEELTGEARTKRLFELAGDSASRKDLFAKLASTWDEIAAAKSANDVAKQAEAENRYDDLKDQITQTNLPSQTLQDILELRGDSKKKKFDELNKRFADFPARLAAIQRFSTDYDAYSKLKGSIDDATELKRLLRGSGVLEFHILATDIPPDLYKLMADRLQKDGPQVRATDEVKWFLLDKPEEFRGAAPPQVYNEKTYVLAYITPDRSLANKPGDTRWALESAYPIFDNAQHKVGFKFNPAGAKLFGDLTGANIGRPLAIVLDDKLISAPNINQQIMGQGEISGGGGAGFSDAEAR
ncbi:MAG: SecDF P1 head subdomain-containing protein, partial [Tepidisphaeraceae bacterium]